MPVSGRELASLDFANLIGGPLNAIVEAQAKSAITTVNFIKEVAFDKDGKIVNVDFSYNRKNDNGNDQEFKLTVPFLTMLPVPYITVNDALIEFNAKITSINESSTESTFKQDVDASAGGRYWFVSAKVQSKTAYQRKSTTTEKEERTFDMHVRVEAKNQDMPAGTERLLTILESSISEKSGKVTEINASVKDVDTNDKKKITISCGDGDKLKTGIQFSDDNDVYTIKNIDPCKNASGDILANQWIFELDNEAKFTAGKLISIKIN
jgi:hypothetical protein